MIEREATEAAAVERIPADDPDLLMRVERLSFWYGAKQALVDIDLDLRRGEVIAFIGPSGCGKSTLLKCLNRMQDDIRGARLKGALRMADGAGHMRDVYGGDVDPPEHRRRFGWVAQKPNPFPTSVFENLAYPARLHGLVYGRAAMRAHVETLLKRAALWDELKDRLREPGTALSGGQQQRLCIARALSLDPELMLMDEPCGSLDPISTERVEDLIRSLGSEVGIVIITHNMEQARRISQRVAFFHLGRLMEVGPTESFFTAPKTRQAQGYLAGWYG